MYLFFGLALFPVVVNMVAAIIKLTMDAQYAAKIRKLTMAEKQAASELEDHESESAPASKAVQVLDSTSPLSALPPETAKERPTVYLLIPVYNEPLPNLIGALNGVAASDYPKLKVFVGFDKLDVEETFFAMCRILSGTPLVGGEVLKDIERQTSRLFPSPSRLSLKGDLKYNGLHQIVSQAQSPAASPALTLGRISSSTGGSFSRNVSSASLSTMAPATPTSAIISQRPLNRSSSSASPSPPLFPHTEHSSASRRSRVSTSASDTTMTPTHPDMFSRDACPTEFNVMYQGVEFTIFRFEHSGKLGTQRNMFAKLKARLQAEAEAAGQASTPQQTAVLFVDSDTHINSDAVSQLVGELDRYPESKACTGFCVSRNAGSWSFWRILQDAEYIESMIYRNAESLLGSVTCLPGVLTMFRWETLCEVASDYFDQAPIETTFDFARRYLGEDRYMSHLLMERYSRRALGFSSAAVCKTEAPDNFYNLLRQRRRWYLGQVSNELIMICTPELWAKFPLLLLTKFLMMLKIGGSLVYLLVFELIFEAIFSPANFSWSLLWWLLLIVVPNWVFISVWCVLTKRVKSAVFFPVYYWINPMFMVIVLLYSIITVNERTWGGPRAATAKAETAGDEEKPKVKDDEVNLDG
ncbi:chitin synthase-domain-containing protein [Catenaria anguillulae PL171]|uniref:chitin synthase n=1 Tax=Catenaria anguillulae PL171 TaxID=765915 RepID=A0A1Y2I241_9FUNG|nr:chitin synthase-domain-containing protein [Catenaria anguillulae PL171]